MSLCPSEWVSAGTRNTPGGFDTATWLSSELLQFAMRACDRHISMPATHEATGWGLGSTTCSKIWSACGPGQLGSRCPCGLHVLPPANALGTWNAVSCCTQTCYLRTISDWIDTHKYYILDTSTDIDVCMLLLACRLRAGWSCARRACGPASTKHLPVPMYSSWYLVPSMQPQPLQPAERALVRWSRPA